MGKLRILYLYSDILGLPEDRAKNPLHYLSRYLTGAYLALWWAPDGSRARAAARRVADALGGFRFHWTRSHRLPPLIRHLWDLCFYVGRGLMEQRRHGPYDAIVAYGPYRTALAGLILRALTGAKLIVEFPGHPFRSYDFYPGLLSRLRRRIAPAWTRFIAARADHVRLLYPDQLDELGLSLDGKASVFHEFTTISSVRPAPSSEKYVLFLGFPFHLKGVDLLIRAFNEISPEFPDHTLQIVGHCPDPAPYLELASGNPRVVIRRAVEHAEAMRLLACCSLFVLPSRIEAMGRVLLEAMALRRPVVASRVGGIPHYVRHGETGLLFESENVSDLAAQLRRVLGDPALAAELADRGYEHVHANLSEEQYAARFHEMVSRVVEKG